MTDYSLSGSMISIFENDFRMIASHSWGQKKSSVTPKMADNFAQNLCALAQETKQLAWRLHNTPLYPLLLLFLDVAYGWGYSGMLYTAYGRGCFTLLFIKSQRSQPLCESFGGLCL